MSDKRLTVRELRRGDRATISVDLAGAILGIGRNQAYQAVHRGEIPALVLGKRILIPVEPFLRLLDGQG